MKAYGDEKCATTALSQGASSTTNGPTVTWKGNYNISQVTGWGPVSLFMSQMPISDFMSMNSFPQTKSIKIEKGICYDVSNTNLETGGKAVKGYKLLSTGNQKSNLLIDLTFSAAPAPNITYKEVTCPVINKAGKHGLRYLRTLPISNILFKNNKKRLSEQVTGHLDQDFPTSDDLAGKESSAYITLKYSGPLTLKDGENVNLETNTIRLQKTSDNIIEVTLAPFAVQTGTIISASANINGENKYGLLKKSSELNNNRENIVSIDLTDFSDEPES